MAATAEPASVRPPPGSPAASSQDEAAKIIPFHPRDILDRATTLEPDFAPAPPVAVPVTRSPRRRAHAVWAAALLLSAVALMLWSARRPTSPAAEATDSTMARTAPDASHVPEPTAAMATPAATTAGVPLPPMLDALHQVSAPLRDCARLVDGVLLVEFKTAEHRERFAGTRVVGEESPAVLRCVDEALASVRFAPAPAQTLIQEYMP